MPERWTLRRRLLLAFATVAFGAAAILGAAVLLALKRIGPDAIPHLALAGGVAVFGIALLTIGVWAKVDRLVARPLEALARQLETEAGAPLARDSVAPPPPCPGPVGPAARKIVDALREARRASDADREAATSAAQARIERLEAVIRDLAEAVIVCGADDRILLYNHEAVRLLGVERNTGLGRPLFSLIAAEPVRHALDRLHARRESGRAEDHADGLSVELVTSDASGRRTLGGRLSLMTDEAGRLAGGYVVTFKDATAGIAARAEGEHRLGEALLALREQAAPLGLIGEALAEAGGADRDRLLALQAEASRRILGAVAAATARFREQRGAGLAMTDVHSATLFACVGRRLGEALAARTRIEGSPCWLHCDSFTVVELLVHVIERLASEAPTLVLSARPEGAHVMIDITWEGARPAVADLDAWLNEPLERSLGALSARDVLVRHHSELWAETCGGGARLRLPLLPPFRDHAGAAAMALPHRPEFYDFGLIAVPRHPDRALQPLRSATYVVFDTETTGLNPGQGDEIVQIAGVRIVNGRVMQGESFDRLVDPGRPIPPAATRIHHIDDRMVAGQPRAPEVLHRFHAYVEDAILVAHNAPFDMAFLRLKEAQAGLRFDHPVLDTVLLSAHLFGQAEEHTLDALTRRFGVAIPERSRHTALGDAIATAEVFLRMLDPLEAGGVRTLGDAERVSADMRAIRRRQARY